MNIVGRAKTTNALGIERFFHCSIRPAVMKKEKNNHPEVTISGMVPKIFYDTEFSCQCDRFITSNDGDYTN